MPSSVAARKTRMAISDRFATSRREILAKPRPSGQEGALSEHAERSGAKLGRSVTFASLYPAALIFGPHGGWSPGVEPAPRLIGPKRALARWRRGVRRRRPQAGA